ncbi:site-specific DNA-methyltransferase [Deferribacterales bacterium RsTz2092]|nr:methyltransferase [Deferribacterales bacterium]
MNNIIKAGDCKESLREISSSSVDLVYLDPPFFTQRTQSLKTRDNSGEYSFCDSWDSIQDYCIYIKERLFECKRVLKETGSIFLHCDKTASHYIRVLLDELFGMDNFQSEIIWHYRRWSNAKKGLLNSHQTIFFYSKSKEFKFNHIFDDYSPTTNIDQIFQKRVRDTHGKTTYKVAENGDYELMTGKRGVPLSDVWYIPYLNPKARERVGYPTQKPLILLEQLIKLVTDEGDVVLDPFCGSGTTLVAAKILGRNYIGFDISEDAIQLVKKRLENPVRTESNLLKNGEQAYINQDVDIFRILCELDAVPVQRNKGIDGFLKIDDEVKPVPIKIQRKDESVEVAKNLLERASSKNKFLCKILIKTNENHDISLFDLSEDNTIIVEQVEDFIAHKQDVVREYLGEREGYLYG